MSQYLVTAIIDILFASFALSKKNNAAAFSLAILLFCAALWSFELYALSVLKNEVTLSYVFHVSRWGMFLIPPCFALLTWRLLGARSKLFPKIVILPCFLLSTSISLLNTFVFPSELVAAEGGYLPKIDGIYYAFVFCFLWSFSGAIGLSISSLKSATNREIKKVKWLSITMTVSFVFGVTNIAFMAKDFYLSSFASTLAHITFVGLLFYSTVQHHLMDLRLALSVGLARAVLLGFLIWLCFLFVSFVGPIGETPGGIVAFIALMILMLEAYPRILQWMLPSTKRLFAGEGFDFDPTRLEFQNALKECANLKKFTTVLDYYLIQLIKSRRYTLLFTSNESVFSGSPALADSECREIILVDDGSKIVSEAQGFSGLIISDEAPESLRSELEKFKASVTLVIRHEKDILGLLAIESPAGRDFFGYDDIRLLEWLQSEIGQVVHRIIELNKMQNQLGQAKKTLSMLGVMNHYHHDIKAPLAIIDGVLSNDIYDKDKQRDIVLKQVERGSQLIATMAGILKGERRRRVRELSLEQVVKDSLFLFSQGIDEIFYQLSDVTNIKGDAEDLKILVINLAKNAMEARRDEGPLYLTIKTWETEDFICLAIKDTGRGIDKKMLAGIWDDIDSFKSYGNGIGLQAIKRIADEHSAEIDVRSELGSGTEFVFKFPRSVSVEKPVDEQVSYGKATVYDGDRRVNKPLAG